MLPNPLQQSDLYARVLRALGTQTRIDWIGDQGRCLIQTRHLPLIGPVNLISRGPVGLTPCAAQTYLRALDLKGPLLVNAVDPPQTGFLRIAKPRQVALLDLGTPQVMRAALHQNWRNALRRAESAGLTVEASPYDPHRHRWLIDAEMAQQKARGYRSLPQRFLTTFAQENPGQAKVFTALDGKTPIAAMLILCHAPWATYHLGLTTEAGRAKAAHHLTLWQAMTWLAQRGYSTLDLGLLTGPPGLDRFKRRSGARAHTLGGTWLRLPRAFRRQFPSIQSPSGQKA